jgi:hypothetical protein
MAKEEMQTRLKKGDEVQIQFQTNTLRLKVDEVIEQGIWGYVHLAETYVPWTSVMYIERLPVVKAVSA